MLTAARCTSNSGTRHCSGYGTTPHSPCTSSASTNSGFCSGKWALESAQFVDDKLAVVAILLDDLGWASYLLNRDIGVTNIERAIRYGEQLPAGFGEPRRSLLLAKAHRHLGVIRTVQQGALAEVDFDRARTLLTAVRDRTPDEVDVDLAHVNYARALAIASMLGVNGSGTIRTSDVEGTADLWQALDLVRQAKDGFQANPPLRDRAVAASAWARPAGAAFITGR